MSVIRRGVGYCVDANCEEYARGVFLLNQEGEFVCPVCRKCGRIEHESGHQLDDRRSFKEVRVEYNFDPVEAGYRDVAIVQDVSLWGPGNVYTLQSPLIRTEKRALKVAEALLANLNRCPEFAFESEVPNTSEVVLSLDDSFDEFSRKLAGLASEWEQSGLRQSPL